MLRIELCGVLREVAGESTLSLSLGDEPPSVTRVLDQLGREHPDLSTHLARIACAQGDELLGRRDVIDCSRPVVLLPPVSGG